jgi:probable rRNA maturation factor
MPTDVLAFDLSAPGAVRVLLADIIISADTAARNAKIFHTTPLYELYLYVVHGVLHLLGYDDKTKAQRKLMHKKAIKYVNTKD